MEANGPLVATDGESAGPNEGVVAHSPVLAVADDLKHVPAFLRDRSARRHHRRCTHMARHLKKTTMAEAEIIEAVAAA